MNKLVIGIVIAVLVVGAGGYLWVTHQNAERDSENTLVDSLEQTTLKSLLTNKKSQQCTVYEAIEGFTSDGTVYFANGKMRGDFSVESQGTLFDTHMIITDGVMHVWMEGETQGFLINLNDATVDEKVKQETPLDLNKDIGVKCSSWRQDQSLFELPSTVTFTDVKAAMNALLPVNAQGATSIDTTSLCEACNQVPAGDAREQCLASLGC